MKNKKGNGSHYNTCIRTECSTPEASHHVTGVVNHYKKLYDGKNGISIGVERFKIGEDRYTDFKWKGPFPEEDFKKGIIYKDGKEISGIVIKSLY